MKKKIILLIVVLGLVLTMVGCARQSATEEEQGFKLYYTAAHGELYGESIVGEPYELVGESVNIDQLLTALFDGPTDQTLTSPFPKGTRILWAGWREDDVLVLNLSEEYSGLMGIDLSLADYCIVRTLCQVDGVERVEILSANQEIQYRNHQILGLEDIL